MTLAQGGIKPLDGVAATRPAIVPEQKLESSQNMPTEQK
jgi:hypothetical protein